VFLGLTGSPGDVLVNAGRIAANAFDDALNNTRINNAVFTEGQNTRITNLAGGVITATSSEGNGVRLGAGSNGSTVTNHGMILSTAAAGVDLSGIGAGETGTLVNSGQVQGFGNALMAQAAAGVLRVTNSGQMIGDVVLGQGNDVFDGRGGRVDGVWSGNGGNDTYDGRGATVITGVISGGLGNDTLMGGDGDETLAGGGDTDLVSGGGGNDVIDGGTGTLSAQGGDGDDRIEVDSTAGNFTSGYGGAGHDTLQGGVSRDDIFGGAGDDEIFADGGDDIVAGGGGDDLIDGFEGADTLAGGAGDDRIVQAGGDASLTGGAGDDTIAAGAGADVVDGGGDDDLLAGDAGRDTVSGGWGQDRLTGGNDDDVLDGGGGEDDLKGGLGNDRAAGGFGADVLAGEGGRDTLAGDTGDDTLAGGASGDQLTGGAGADVFLFTLAADSGVSGTARDTVADFQPGVDHLDLRGIDAKSAVAGDQAFSYIGGAAFGGVAGQLRYAAGTGVLSGDLNGDRVADFAVFLQGRPVLTVADLYL
jgi:Ca2+-binding RTX toxin-like protein